VLIGGMRSPHAVLPARLLTTRAAAGAVGAGLALYFAFYGAIFTLSLYFQQVLHYGPARTGLLFVPMTLLITGATVVSGRWSARAGPFVPMATGLLGMAVGFVALSGVSANSPVWVFAAATVPIGLGSGIAGPAIPIALLAALPPERSGIASGVANALRQVAATIGVAVFGALLVAHAGLAGGLPLACLVAAITLLAGFVLLLTCGRGAAPPAAA
jgi:MFS transporter, DHA2 family, methylenomycin A resistance protein